MQIARSSVDDPDENREPRKRCDVRRATTGLIEDSRGNDDHRLFEKLPECPGNPPLTTEQRPLNFLPSVATFFARFSTLPHRAYIQVGNTRATIEEPTPRGSIFHQRHSQTLAAPHLFLFAFIPSFFMLLYFLPER